jgi:hypothetical protein
MSSNYQESKEWGSTVVSTFITSNKDIKWIAVPWVIPAGHGVKGSDSCWVTVEHIEIGFESVTIGSLFTTTRVQYTGVSWKTQVFPTCQLISEKTNLWRRDLLFFDDPPQFSLCFCVEICHRIYNDTCFLKVVNTRHSEPTLDTIAHTVHIQHIKLLST